MFNHSRHKIDVVVRITYDDINLKYFNQLQELYPLIQDCKYVPKIKFLKNQIEMPYCGKSLDLIKKITVSEKTIIKEQIISFVKDMYARKIAHRDLWIKNICWDGSQIWIIDWEYITKHEPSYIVEHYDLTGKGLKSPKGTNQMNIFHRHRTSISNWLNPISLTIADFA